MFGANTLVDPSLGIPFCIPPLSTLFLVSSSASLGKGLRCQMASQDSTSHIFLEVVFAEQMEVSGRGEMCAPRSQRAENVGIYRFGG